MSPKHPFWIGELVRCECPEGVCKLPFGLPSHTAVEVVASQLDTTRVQYYGKSFTLPTACVFPRELTPRQREILVLIAEGRSTSEIARSLGVSIKTVESHRALLKERLGIHSVAGLVRYALRLGLIS